jgi:hypothetical protein
MLPPPSSKDDDDECDCHECDECLEADVFLAGINHNIERLLVIVGKMREAQWTWDRIIKAIRGD